MGIGPSVLRAPAEQTKVATIGPSRVRALPLAAGINEGGHYWSEQSACAALGCWHKRRWPLFLIYWYERVVCASRAN